MGHVARVLALALALALPRLGTPSLDLGTLDEHHELLRHVHATGAEACYGELVHAQELLLSREYAAAAKAFAKGFRGSQGRGCIAVQGAAHAVAKFDADCRQGAARALKKVGRHAQALAQLELIKTAAATLPSPLREKVESGVWSEMSAVQACAGRLPEAIDLRKDALLKIDALLSGDGASLASEELFARECVELARLLIWAGQSAEAEQVQAMALQSGHWKDAMQLPGAKFVPELEAKPWHSAKRGAYQRLAPAMALLQESASALRGEFLALAASDKHVQNECLHEDGRGRGAWAYVPAFGAHANYNLGASACNPSTPVACRLARTLAGMEGGLVRLGYSSLEASARIRPHWGPSNTQLKAHLGLIVPTTGTGNGACAELVVGGTSKTWEEGKVLFFDDSFLHHVWNNCSAARVVLQAVFRHPQYAPTRQRDEL